MCIAHTDDNKNNQSESCYQTSSVAFSLPFDLTSILDGQSVVTEARRICRICSLLITLLFIKERFIEFITSSIPTKSGLNVPCFTSQD